MISEAIDYPRSNDAVRTLLIGGLLTLTSVLLLPAIVLVGYFMRVLRTVARGDERAPAFEDWGSLLRDGVRGSVVVLAYGLLSAVGGLVLVGGAFALADGAGALGVLGVAVGGLLWFALLLFAAYVSPAALANVAENGRIADGFDADVLRPVLTSSSYAIAWLIAALFVLTGGVVAGTIGVIPGVGPVVGAFIGFYAAVAAYYVIGRAWGDREEVDVAGTEPETVTRPAA